MIMHSVRTACCVTGCLARSARVVNVRCSSTASHAPQVPRFYAAQLPAVVGGCIELDPEEAKHAVRVLRLRANDAVELCDGSGRVVRCIVTYTDKNSAAVSAVQEPQTLPWTGPEWVLAVGCLTLKGGRADWLVEKATELGARSLIPLITQRSQSAGKNKFKVSSGSSQDSPAAAGDFNAGRSERLAVAATKQSLRAHGLQLQAPTAVEALLPLVRASPLSLLATAGAPPVVQALAAAPQPPAAWCNQPCYLLVGPEGDFTPDEVAALTAAGALPVGLGPNRLRTETAALALLSTAAMYAGAQPCGASPAGAARGAA